VPGAVVAHRVHVDRRVRTEQPQHDGQAEPISAAASAITNSVST
jgi:hypothetical protein